MTYSSSTSTERPRRGAPQQAALHYATDDVAWYDGEGTLTTLRGGWNMVTGRQSLLEVHPIIALRGAPKVNLFDIEPSFSRAKLIVRDRSTCAYCGEVFRDRDLTVEHILPQSRGGKDGWTSCVAACRPATLARRTARPRKRACRCCSCRTARASSSPSCSKDAACVPTCTSGCGRGSRGDLGFADPSQRRALRGAPFSFGSSPRCGASPAQLNAAGWPHQQGDPYAGLDASSDATDDLVCWVAASSADAVKAAIEDPGARFCGDALGWSDGC